LLQYKAVGKSNILLFKTRTSKELKRMGKANNIDYFARAMVWLIVQGMNCIT
jgi:hypothetical protein